jgi:hypothetical protein
MIKQYEIYNANLGKHSQAFQIRTHNRLISRLERSPGLSEYFIYRSNQFRLAVYLKHSLRVRIRKVLVSNLARNTGYSKIFMVFPQGNA